jgi:hypothetical protein
MTHWTLPSGTELRDFGGTRWRSQSAAALTHVGHWGYRGTWINLETGWMGVVSMPSELVRCEERARAKP